MCPASATIVVVKMLKPTRFRIGRLGTFQKVPRARRSKDAKIEDYTDVAVVKSVMNTLEGVEQHGTIQFYCKENTLFGGKRYPGIGNLKTQGWHQGVGRLYGNNGICDTQSGALYSTAVQPKWWSRYWDFNGNKWVDESKAPVEGPAFRSFKVQWCCCATELLSGRPCSLCHRDVRAFLKQSAVKATASKTSSSVRIL